MKRLSFLLTLCLLAKAAHAIPSFPGAQGGGAASLGGRGGVVIEVINTSDSGTGSLRACIQDPRPRTCVFRKGGTIQVLSELTISSPFITIAGQTAPGGGIQLKANTTSDTVLKPLASNVIVRYIRIRHGSNPSCSGECGGNVIFGAGAIDQMFDHVSATWNQDEGFGIAGQPSRSVTVQWTLSGEGVSTTTESHSTSYLFSSNTPEKSASLTNADLHHNLTMTNNHRNPLLRNKTTRIVNNIWYNHRLYATHLSGGVVTDIIGNIYKRGPMNPNATYHEVGAGINISAGKAAPGNPSIYMFGNIGWHQTSPTGDQFVMTNQISGENGPDIGPMPSSWRRNPNVPQANTAHPIIAEPVGNIEASILPIVGASRKLDCNGNWVMNRDDHDIKMVNEYINNNAPDFRHTNESGFGGYPFIADGTPCPDADHDGMPDAWETSRVPPLNPNNAADRNGVQPTGYTNLEVYLAGPQGAPLPSPPSVNITAPSNGAVVSGGSVTVSADASDDSAVLGVQFKLDGVNLGAEDTSVPYSVLWNTTTASEGGHTLTAVARDAVPNSTTSAPVTVTVDNVPNQPPTVSVTAPSNGATVSGAAVTVSANATDDVGVAGVQFKVDGQNLGAEDVAAPYSVVWNTTTATNISHTLTAVARDATPTFTTSAPITVTVNNGAPAPQPPVVTMTAPSNGATVSGSSVTVSANASDDVAVLGVQFKLDGADLGAEDTSAPYSIFWNTTTASEGPHALTAVARDAVPNITTSSAVNATVDNVVSGFKFDIGDRVEVNNGAITVRTQPTQGGSAGNSLGNQPLGARGTVLAGPITASNGGVYWQINYDTSIDGWSAEQFLDEVAGPVNVPPTTSLTAPPNGATVSGPVTVSATASDDVGVLGVQFKLDGADLGAEDTTAPYSVVWNTAQSAAGSHQLGAVARDTVGATVSAAQRTVTVNNENVCP